MKLKFLYVIIYLFGTLMLENAIGKTIIGYKKDYNSKIIELHEVVDRIVESKTDFKVLLKYHPSFYNFPINNKNYEEIKKILNDSRLTNTKIKITADAGSRNIYFIDITEVKK